MSQREECYHSTYFAQEMGDGAESLHMDRALAIYVPTFPTNKSWTIMDLP